MALAFDGRVSTFGQGICRIYLSTCRFFSFIKLPSGHLLERLIGLPDLMLKNRSNPQVVPSLEGLFIEDIAVGCEHVLALSSTGDVYAWGCNSEGQVNQYPLLYSHTLAAKHHKHFTSYLIVLLYPAWAWTLQPSKGTNTNNGPAGEEHQADFSWSLPQFCMDRPLYLKELRYKLSCSAHMPSYSL